MCRRVGKDQNVTRGTEPSDGTAEIDTIGWNGARRAVKSLACSDPLGRAPYPDHLRTGINALHADVGGLPSGRRVRSADDLLLAGLIGEAIADPKLHRQDLADGRHCRLALCLGPTAQCGGRQRKLRRFIRYFL